jgi:hypothetical protein
LLAQAFVIVAKQKQSAKLMAHFDSSLQESKKDTFPFGAFPQNAVLHTA